MLPRSFTARARKGELRMRKFLLLFAGALMLLSGCSTSEIGERAIIQAAAVDYDGEYIVSALLFSSGGGSGELVNAADENVIKVTGRGSTFSEAVDDISLVDGKEIFMSENRLLILGAGFVETDFTPALETLSRDMRCSLNMLVCTADDPEILTDLHFKEGLTAAEKPVSMIENAYSSGLVASGIPARPAERRGGGSRDSAPEVPRNAERLRHDRRRQRRDRRAVRLEVSERRKALGSAGS